MIIFARVNVLVWFVGLQVHRAELEESETSAVTAHSFLAKENRTAVPYPYEWKNEHEKWSAKDQCCRGGNDVEQSFQVMVGRNASQLKTIQPPRQTKATTKKNRTRGNRGLRLLTSNSTPQRTKAASKIQFVIWMLVDVVAPYAHGAYIRAAQKIQRDAARQI